nr:hypothetical protein [uncultured Mucilaginibacter sp.]
MVAIHQTKPANMERLAALVILIWGAASFLFGYYHVFDNTSSKVFGFCIVTVQAVLVLLYFFNTAVNRYLNQISLSTITLIHTWRLFAGWAFIAYAGQLPQTFINNAAYGDLVAGVLAICVFLSGRKKWAFYAFNIIGMLDFMLAVGTGITLSLSNAPGTELLTKLPLIIIPFFGVPISGLTHIVSLTRLLKMKEVGLAGQVNG